MYFLQFNVGLNTKIHAIVGKDLRPVAFLLSAGNVDDCTEAVPLLKLLPNLKDCDKGLCLGKTFLQQIRLPDIGVCSGLEHL